MFAFEDLAHLGKLGFYLMAVDAEIKHASDGPTIGLLCAKVKQGGGRIRAARPAPAVGRRRVSTDGVPAG